MSAKKTINTIAKIFIILGFVFVSLTLLVTLSFFAFTEEPELMPGGVYTELVEVNVKPPAGTKIYYTLDGSIPNENSESTDADVTLTIDHTTTIRAYASRPWRIDSNVVSSTYEIHEKSPNIPTISMANGTYQGAQIVYAECKSNDVQIHYTLDGSQPTSQSPVLSKDKPTVIVSSGVLTAQSFMSDGQAVEEPVSQEYTIVNAAVTAPNAVEMPKSGTYEGAVEIPLSGTPKDSYFFYTTDGTDPTVQSDYVRGGDKLAFDKTGQVRIMVIRPSENPSGVTMADYVIQNAEPVVRELPDQSTAKRLAVEITPPTADSKVYYTLDGSRPNTKSMMIQSRETVMLTKTSTLKAFCKAQGREDSKLFSKKFVVGAPRGAKKDSKRKMIALTFDDGPGKYTGMLLDGLKKRKIHATFFMLGMNVNSYKKEVTRVGAEGHEIGNHTWSHTKITKMTDKEYAQEIKKTNDAIEALTGKRPKLFRPPGGTFIDKVVPEHMRMVLWSVDTRDWQHRNEEYVYTYIVDTVKSGDVVLMHDLYETSVKSVLRAIDTLEEQGYEFMTYSQLLQEINK